MRKIVTLCAAVVALAIFCNAQEPSLGDVARASRNSTAPKAKKVYSNEDEGEQKALTKTDDPLKVVANAVKALARNTDYRCREESRQTTAPTWTETTIVEVAGRDRVHTLTQDGRIGDAVVEAIVIGDDGYLFDENHWAKKTPGEIVSRLGHAPAEGILVNSDALSNPASDLHFISAEPLSGTSTFHYGSVVRSGQIDRTIHLWIGEYDGLLYRSDLQSSDHTLNRDLHQVVECSYGVQVKIEAP